MSLFICVTVRGTSVAKDRTGVASLSTSPNNYTFKSVVMSLAQIIHYGLTDAPEKTNETETAVKDIDSLFVSL